MAAWPTTSALLASTLLLAAVTATVAGGGVGGGRSQARDEHELHEHGHCNHRNRAVERASAKGGKVDHPFSDLGSNDASQTQSGARRLLMASAQPPRARRQPPNRRHPPPLAHRRPPPAHAGPDALCSYYGIDLPKGVRPVHYDLDIEIRFNPILDPDASLDFDQAPGAAYVPANLTAGLEAVSHAAGRAGIQVAIAAPTNCVVLHATFMRLVTNVTYAWHGMVWQGKVLPQRTLTEGEEDFQMVILKFGSALPAAPPSDPGTLSMHFAYGLLAEGLEGLYTSTFTDLDGVDHVMASTYLEATHARKVFPCWDEPGIKASFAYTLTTPPGLVVLGNTDALSTAVLPDGRIKTVFRKTPIMSAYTLAWVVGELASVNMTCVVPAPGKTIPIAVWSTPDQADKLDTSLAVACVSVQTFTAAFDRAYDLEKIDLVGIPNLAPGAMENWGLITFRESSLLVDPADTNSVELNWVVNTVAHEVSHMWFGNLVTMDQWTEVWLNEGFATYLQTVAADVYRPKNSYFEWQYWYSVSWALEVDTYATLPPLSRTANPVTTLGDIENFFNTISYDKGGAVLRMLRAYLNRGKLGKGRVQRLRRSRALQAADDATFDPLDFDSDPFLLALRQYLADRQYSSATAKQLWAIMSNATGEPLTQYMDKWTYQQNYPILQASLHTLPGAAAPVLRVSQASSNGLAACQPSTAWWVPLNYLLPDASHMEWSPFSTCTADIPLAAADPASSFVLLNPGRFGFYRVNYTEEMWAKLADAAADPEVIPAADLSGLLDDSYSLQALGELGIGPFLELAGVLGTRLRAEPIPWATALYFLSILRAQLQHAAAAQAPGGSGGANLTSCSLDMATYSSERLTGPLVANLTELGWPLVGLSYQTAPGESIQIKQLRRIALHDAANIAVQRAYAIGPAAVAALPGQEPFKSAIALMQPLLADPSAGPPELPLRDLRGAFSAYVVSGGAKAWDNVRKLYEQATDPTLADTLLVALYEVPPEAASIQTALEYALSPAVSSGYMGWRIAAVMRSSPLGHRLSWQFVFNRTDDMLMRFGGTDEAAQVAASVPLGGALSSVSYYFYGSELLPGLQAWLAKYPSIMGSGFLGAVQANIAYNQDWVAGPAQDLCGILGQYA